MKSCCRNCAGSRFLGLRTRKKRGDIGWFQAASHGRRSVAVACRDPPARPDKGEVRPLVRLLLS